jgi:hypothetical protein
VRDVSAHETKKRTARLRDAFRPETTMTSIPRDHVDDVRVWHDCYCAVVILFCNHRAIS